MTRLPDTLFYAGELRLALEEQARRLVNDVGAVPEDHALHADEEAWAAALVERWSVAAPELLVDQMWQDPIQEVQVDVSHEHFERAIFDPSTPTYIAGYRVVVHIPFKGDRGVFALRPSSFNMNPPQATVRDDELIDVIEYPHDRLPDIGAQARGMAQQVGQYLTWARNDIEQFNQTLEQTALNAIRTRRERLERHHAHVQAAGLPVGPPDTSKKTYIADAIVRRPAPMLPSLPDSAPIPLEPVLANEVFEHILSIIRSAGQDMERSPKAYAGMGEEDRRQTLLLALNTHYRGRTVAEAFNVSGKTDLLVRHDGQNLFVGECKFWSGAKGFIETVDQLFGYQAWRDSKLAVVMFVRERDLTSIVAKARSALEQHQQFVEWGAAATETELRCTVTWAGDERRFAELNVFFVHTPDP